MNEECVILKVKFGYFNGVNYDTNEAVKLILDKNKNYNFKQLKTINHETNI